MLSVCLSCCPTPTYTDVHGRYHSPARVDGSDTYVCGGSPDQRSTNGRSIICTLLLSILTFHTRCPPSPSPLHLSPSPLALIFQYITIFNMSHSLPPPPFPPSPLSLSSSIYYYISGYISRYITDHVFGLPQ